MSHKHQVLVFLAVALSLVLILPISNLLDSLFSRDAQREPLTQERLFSTDTAQGLLRYQAWTRFGRSLDKGQVVAGRDGYLFLGNDFNKVLDKATGRFPIDPVSVDRWATGLAELKQWYQSQRIPFVIAVAPNKHTIYPEKLPGDQTSTGKSLTDHLLGAAAQKGVTVLDLRAPLRAARGDQPLYYQTDTHWNRRAAGLAYQALITFAAEQTGLPLLPVPIELVPGRSGPGDLTRLLKLDRFVAPDIEEDPRFALDPVPACVGDLDLPNTGVNECKPTDRPTAILKEAGQYSVTDQPLNPLRVLLLGDSFSNAQTSLMARTFSTVWFVHWLLVKPPELAAFARAVKPGLVIYQVVERDLFDDRLIARLPGL